MLLRQIKFFCPIRHPKNGFWNNLIFILVLTPSPCVGVAIILIVTPSTGHAHNLYRLKFGYNFLSWNECTDLNFFCPIENIDAKKLQFWNVTENYFLTFFYLDCIVPLPIKKITFSWCDIASTICKHFSYFHLSLLSFTFNSKLLLFVYRWVYFKPNESWNLGYDTLYCIIHLFYVHKGLVDPF